MRPITVRAILMLASMLAVSAVRAAAQLTVTQGAGCPAPQLAVPVNSGGVDSSPVRDSAARAPIASRDSSRTGQADVVLLIAFSANELRFNSQPDARIRFCWGGDSLHVVERRNLPSPVVAGTTYRNVFIAAELRAYLNAECVSERLGLSASTGAAQAGSLCADLGVRTSGGGTTKAGQQASGSSR